MAEMTMPKHGEICWQELNTKNLEQAKNFYGELLGWKLEQSKNSPVPYLEIHLGDRAQGGMMEISRDWGENWEKIPSAWMTYIAVDDVDAAAAKVSELGGGVCVPPTDIPNVRRFCVVNAPDGATFSMITLKHHNSPQS